MEERPANRRSILVVDDEKSICLLLKQEIERCRHTDRVITALDSFEALDQLQRQSFNLLIVDYQIPGLNGIELARRVRRNFPETRVVLMSGHDLTLLQVAIEDIAFDGYLQKPFYLKQVFETIEAVLESQRESL